MGVTLQLTNTVTAGTALINGSAIATSLTAKTFSIAGNAQKVTSIQTNGTQPGAYTFTAAGAVLKAAWTDSNSVAHTDSVDLTNLTFSAGQDTSIAFADAGITLNIHNFQAPVSKTIEAAAIAALTSQSGAGAGILTVVNSGTNQLNFQSGPTSSSFIQINTANMYTGTGGTYAGSNLAMQGVGNTIAGSTGLSSLNANTSGTTWQSAFQAAAAAIDTGLDFVSTQRSAYGSQMNRLSYISQNLTAQSTNLQTSKSAITDTNFAAETATLTKGQIMQQAATAMLAQANQMPNVILSLLK
jgi:flagellin